jgi:hypothetical protein
MSEEEKELAQSYAKLLKGMSLSEAIKKVYFETIEDEFDITLPDRAMAEYKKNGKTISFAEMKKELGL